MMQTFLSCCEDFGVPIAWEKTVLILLGLEIDSNLMQVRIHIEKVQVLVSQIHDILKHKRSLTLKALQSVLDSLNFIVPGRPFCRRLINATCVWYPKSTPSYKT